MDIFFFFRWSREKNWWNHSKNYRIMNKKMAISIFFSSFLLFWQLEFFEDYQITIFFIKLFPIFSNRIWQLCRMDLCHGLTFFNFHLEFSIGFRSGLFCERRHWVDKPFMKKNFSIFCFLEEEALTFWKNDFIITNLFSINGMRNVPQISM